MANLLKILNQTTKELEKKHLSQRNKSNPFAESIVHKFVEGLTIAADGNINWDKQGKPASNASDIAADLLKRGVKQIKMTDGKTIGVNKDSILMLIRNYLLLAEAKKLIQQGVQNPTQLFKNANAIQDPKMKAVIAKIVQKADQDAAVFHLNNTAWDQVTAEAPGQILDEKKFYELIAQSASAPAAPPEEQETTSTPVKKSNLAHLRTGSAVSSAPVQSTLTKTGTL